MYTMSDGTKYFILLQKKTGKKKERSFTPSLRPSKVDVLAGALLILCHVQENRPSYILVLETIESEREVTEVECIPGEVENISPDLLDLLRPIPVHAERLNVYLDKEWIKEGIKLRVNDPVTVKLKGHQSELPGVIRYKGPVSDINGIYFGVELTDGSGSGTSDGTFRKKRYFHCEPESAIFCAIHKIRRSQGGVMPQNFGAAAGSIAALQQPMTRQRCSLQLGNRVVWVSDNGPEHGTVKWIGTLPDDIQGDITVGVEFDNKVGSGTGKYKDTRLFFAKQGHASLVPILGLMKEEEFSNSCGPVVPEDEFRGTSHEDVVRRQQELLEKIQTPMARGSGLPPPLKPSAPLAAPSPLPPPPLANNFSGTMAAPDSNSHHQRLLQYQQQAADFHAAPTVPSTSGERQNPPPSYNEVMTEGGLNPLYELSKSGDFPASSTEDPISDEGRQLPSADPDLSVGSLVEVRIPKHPPRYGVIRWIGDDGTSKKLIAGLEMEEEISAGTDGVFKGLRKFTCTPKKALFIPLYKCTKDKRFANPSRKQEGAMGFGCLETPDVPGTVSPPSSLEELSELCGKNKGIQGHHNSCYLDATLLSMFFFTTVYDAILYRRRRPNDIQQYDEVQKVLREGIVNPLRKNFYVRADKVMKLRELLDKFGRIPGMMNEEKDPEEFLTLLLSDIMHADPPLHLSSGENSYFYQLFMEKDEKIVLPTTQKLLELSFVQSNVKLKEIPSCLILQMPRFGKDYKMYRRIIPSLALDITDILENDPRECIICGQLAEFECKECYQIHGPGLNTTAFCNNCCQTSHLHKSRRDHNPQPITVHEAFHLDVLRRREEAAARHEAFDLALPRVKMELFAIVCIQTSHYVSFVKSGRGPSATWLFFDSMADRMGEQGGYNIPEVRRVPDLSDWLSEPRFQQINSIEDDKDLPEHVRRALCDVYMCMYQSTDVMMFN